MSTNSFFRLVYVSDISVSDIVSEVKNMAYRKIMNTSAIMLLLISLFTPFTFLVNPVESAPGNFVIKDVVFKSRTGGDVYPGSQGAELTVQVQYIDSSDSTNIYACISLPQGFTLASSACTPAENLTGSPVSTVTQGMIIQFNYKIDVDKTVAPGNYSALLNITYYYTGNSTLLSESFNITLHVKPYPPLQVRIVSTYWSPAGYPGETNAALNIEIENTGESTIVYADINASLPGIIEPNDPRTTISNLPEENRAVVSFTGLSISPNADPGNYSGTLYINAQMSTSDGVRYNASATIPFTFKVEEPPPINLTILDYGLTSYYPSPGSKGTSIYLTIQSIDTATIRLIVANITLENAVFLNGSNRIVQTVNGPINYGDVFSIVTDKIDIGETASYVKATFILNMLCEENGATFWNKTKITITIRIQPRALKIMPLNSYWANINVYPGSIDQDFVVNIVNLEHATLQDVVATLYLPNGFSPDKVVSSGYTIGSGNIVSIVFRGIDIDRETPPGQYIGKLVIDGILRENDGSYREITLSYNIVIYVNETKIHVTELKTHTWIQGEAYSGMIDTGIHVTLQVVSDVTIREAYIKLILPNGLVSEKTGKNYDIIHINNPVGYGGVIDVSFTGIDISQRTHGTQPFTLEISMIVSIDGAQTWINETHVFFQEIKIPKLNLTLIDKGWSTDVVSKHMDNAGIYLTLQSLMKDTIRTIVIKLELPEGTCTNTGNNTITYTSTVNLNYGGIISPVIRGINVNTAKDTLEFKATITAVIYKDGATYNASKTIVFRLNTTSQITTFILSRVATLYNTEPAPLLPSAKGVTLSITLVNQKAVTITSIIAEIKLPEGIEARSTTRQVSGNIASGERTTINYVLDISDNIKPGTYTATLKLTYLVNTNGAVVEEEETHTFTLVVADPVKYLPSIKLLDAYWGTTIPTYVYPGDRRAPLSIILGNDGPYTATGVRILVKQTTQDVELLNNNVTCSTTLAPGTTCRSVFYLDLRNAEPGRLGLAVDIVYLLRIYGANLIIEKQYSINVPINRFESSINGTKIMLVNAGWANDWPAYPNSTKAKYQVVLANLYPYSISSILIRLVPPEGITASTNYSLSTYIPGPINSLQELTATFTLDIGNLKPGIYDGYILVDYLVESNGPGYRDIVKIHVIFNISDPNNAITLLETSWVGQSPSLDAHGAVSYIVVRDDNVPSMSGIVLTLYLPSGILYAPENSSVARITPSTIIPSTQLQGETSYQQQILKLLLTGQQQLPAPSSASKGDVITFTAKLNLDLKEPGTYYARAVIEFVDHWGQLYRINKTIPIRVYGVTPKIEIGVSQPIVFINGSGNLTIDVINNGSSPIYNVYVGVAPMVPLAIPEDSIKYLSVIKPGETVSLTYNVVYNPLGIMGYQGATSITYSSVPFKLVVMYRDPTGYMIMYNTSIAATIKPFIDLELSRSTTIRFRDGKLSVSGLIINYGISQARSLEVVMIYENKTASSFIGDIDPASQTAFRLEIPLDHIGEGTATIKLVYRDEYNNVYTKTFKLPITIETTSTMTTTPAPVPISETYHFLVIVIVAVFLAGVFYIIYRLYKRYMKKLQQTNI